jgi:hypothetical protein
MGPRQREEVEARLHQQRLLLCTLCETFDCSPDNEHVSLAIATAIRVLVHDTKHSHSLLDQLGLKSRLQFLDTALPIGALSKTQINPGLVSVEVAVGGTGVRWIPPLSHLPAARLSRRGPFQPWWETNIHRDPDGNTWSRRDFVLHLANSEGGAHVDPNRVTPDYEGLEFGNTTGFSVHHSELGSFDSGSPLPASVRQVAYELERTLEER